MKTVIATVIEKNEYRIKIDVENDATEYEIWDVDSNYDIKIKNSR